jgi:hypothetical protein
VPIYWEPGGNQPDGVAVARTACLVRDVITPEDSAFFDDTVPAGRLYARYAQCRDQGAAAVLAKLAVRQACGGPQDVRIAEMMDEIIIGLLLGYPRCCVKNFAQVVHGGKPQHEFAEVAWLKNSLYGLCLECAREGRIKYNSEWQVPDKRLYICEECQHCWDHPGRACVYDCGD